MPLQFLKHHSGKSWSWFRERAEGAHARLWLLLLAFTESSFFLIPPDILLIAIIAAGSERFVYYAALTTLGSVAGAVFGYVIAAFFFETVGARIIELYHLQEEFAYVGRLFENNVFWVVFTAAFTPIPYKVFVLAAGFFQVSFWPFLVASVLGRGIRFLLVSYLVYAFGVRVSMLFLRYFKQVTVIAVLLAGLAAAWYFGAFDVLREWLR